MELAVERLLAKPAQRRAERHRRIALSGNRISAVAPGKPGEGAGLLALPALTNAHDHARAVKPVALGALELPLELNLVTRAEQFRLVEEIGRAIESDLVTVQFGPAAVQWCSHALLSAIAERSAATGRRVHMHLLETRYQREWADREYPQGMLKFLDSIGLLSPRLSVAHAVWARPAELELLDELPLVLARATSRHIKALYVAGRQVLSEGRLTGIELAALEAQLVAQLRSGLADFNEWQRTVLRMRAGLTRFYATGMHCS